MTYLRVPKPMWLRLNDTDKLNTLFQNKRTLFTHGVVTWGRVVQANAAMFQSEKGGKPGEILFSLDPPESIDVGHLDFVAHSLFRLKGTQPTDEGLRPIAHYLTDEYIRVFGLSVPSTVSGEMRCEVSTTFFVREHLPNRRLCNPLLPIIVNPQPPHVVMPLPDRYWPNELIRWWRR